MPLPAYGMHRSNRRLNVDMVPHVRYGRGDESLPCRDTTSSHKKELSTPSTSSTLPHLYAPSLFFFFFPQSSPKTDFAIIPFFSSNQPFPYPKRRELLSVWLHRLNRLIISLRDPSAWHGIGERGWKAGPLAWPLLSPETCSQEMRMDSKSELRS